MEKLTITVQMDKHYGCYVYYPICAKAKIIAEMMGTKTLTSKAMQAISKLGYDIVSKDLVNKWDGLPS